MAPEDSPLLRLYYGDDYDDWTDIDFTIIRASLWTFSIPPPTRSEAHEGGRLDEDEVDDIPRRFHWR
eukprot:8310273-Pyramimonas_sp.AAC.1